jgi:hypothetical protein
LTRGLFSEWAESLASEEVSYSAYVPGLSIHGLSNKQPPVFLRSTGILPAIFRIGAATEIAGGTPAPQDSFVPTPLEKMPLV